MKELDFILTTAKYCRKVDFEKYINGLISYTDITIYEIINTTKLKHPNTGEWIPAIIYKVYYNDSFAKDERIWVRIIDDFKANFIDINENLK